MKIRFTEYIYPEEFNFHYIIRKAGYAHEVDADEVVDNLYSSGTRELEVNLELDTETGIIKVLS
jgi:hypothetical protein